MTARPYRIFDDAQWPDLPDVIVETDDGGAAVIVHDPAAREAAEQERRERDLAETQERLYDPSFSFRA